MTSVASTPRNFEEWLETMAQLHTRVLYLGRNQTIADDLRVVLRNLLGASANGKHSKSDINDDALRMEVVSSQKLATPVAQRLNPTLIVVETSNKPDSRLRFCQWLRERVPAASIVAIGSTVLPYRFEFDGVLRTPIDASDVSSVIAQLPPPCPKTMRLGNVELDVSGRTVRTPNGEHSLTPKECALLHLLMERVGTVVCRAEIINRIWETSYLDDTRTLDVHMRWLRSKVEVDPSAPIFLRTRRGKGYYFHLPETMHSSD